MDRATAEVVSDQIACGVDLPTDGEVRRENYVHYQCRHFDGFDFENLTKRVLRNGAYVAELPTIRGPVKARGESVLVRDWQVAEAAAGRPVKITLPGPMTISDTTADEFYKDPARQADELAVALNAEVRALAEAGCRFIQIDEPVFARKPDAALDFGVATLARCFEGVPKSVTRVMHMCCGYPNRLDDTDYPKADPASYLRVARAVDGIVDQVSIEDAHRHNPAELFALFERATLIVGFVRVADQPDRDGRRNCHSDARGPAPYSRRTADCGAGLRTWLSGPRACNDEAHEPLPGCAVALTPFPPHLPRPYGLSMTDRMIALTAISGLRRRR